jgi:hypothetical protein
MVHRNNKGQILLEAMLLVSICVATLLILQGLIDQHKTKMNEFKKSKEIKRSFRSEDAKD